MINNGINAPNVTFPIIAYYLFSRFWNRLYSAEAFVHVKPVPTTTNANAGRKPVNQGPLSIANNACQSVSGFNIAMTSNVKAPNTYVKNVYIFTNVSCKKNIDRMTKPAKIAKLMIISIVFVSIPNALKSASKVNVPVDTFTDSQPT